MGSFADLVDSRRRWIADVLQPWCRQSARKELLLAEMEWTDLAGKAPPDKTLWAWAWSRFPALCDDALGGLNETHSVVVHLQDGATASGYPDARESQHGQLVLVADDGTTLGPFSIDSIAHVEPATQRRSGS